MRFKNRIIWQILYFFCSFNFWIRPCNKEVSCKRKGFLFKLLSSWRFGHLQKGFKLFKTSIHFVIFQRHHGRQLHVQYNNLLYLEIYPHPKHFQMSWKLSSFLSIFPILICLLQNISGLCVKFIIFPTRTCLDTFYNSKNGDPYYVSESV